MTDEINTLEAEMTAVTEQLAPTLLLIPGCASLTAAKILGETAGILRFHSAAGCARHNGTVPLAVWSAIRARHRLSRIGNRQLNAVLHRIAMTQATHRQEGSSCDAKPGVTAAWEPCES